MILLALAAITYGCYLVHPALGWIVGGFFLASMAWGKHQVAEEQKRRQRIDAVADRIIREYSPARERRPEVQ